MKINLNHRTCGTTRYTIADKILEKVAEEFCEEYDVYPSQNTIANLKDYTNLLPLLINFAVSKGWKITTWELPRPNNDSNLYAYGLDFDKDCPLFMEARLKYS
jgi:hypothetical protein